MFYCVSFQPHIRVENSPNGPLCSHYPASTVSKHFPLLISSITFSLILVKAFWGKPYNHAIFTWKIWIFKKIMPGRVEGQMATKRAPPWLYSSLWPLEESGQWPVGCELLLWVNIWLSHLLIDWLLESPESHRQITHLPHSIFLISEMALTLFLIFDTQSVNNEV